jgi:hypothetical protein
MSLPGYIRVGNVWEHYSWTQRENLWAEIVRLRSLADQAEQQQEALRDLIAVEYPRGGEEQHPSPRVRAVWAKARAALSRDAGKETP